METCFYLPHCIVGALVIFLKQSINKAWRCEISEWAIWFFRSHTHDCTCPNHESIDHGVWPTNGGRRTYFVLILIKCIKKILHITQIQWEIFEQYSLNDIKRFVGYKDYLFNYLHKPVIHRQDFAWNRNDRFFLSFNTLCFSIFVLKRHFIKSPWIRHEYLKRSRHSNFTHFLPGSDGKTLVKV